jgi:hypothetical protein
MKKGLILQKDITLLSEYAHNSKVSKFIGKS